LFGRLPQEGSRLAKCSVLVATGTDPETLRPFEQALVSALQALGHVAGHKIFPDYV
jgi:hypothetical protein